MKKITLYGIFSLFLTNCASFTLSNESLINQLKSNQKLKEVRNLSSLGSSYPSNNLKRIECIDKKGNNVWMYPDKNVSFIVQKKSNHNKISIYFDTLILQNDTLFGLRSRILGGLRKIPINDVEKISINAEAARTEIINSPVNQ